MGCTDGSDKVNRTTGSMHCQTAGKCMRMAIVITLLFCYEVHLHVCRKVFASRITTDQSPSGVVRMLELQVG